MFETSMKSGKVLLTRVDKEIVAKALPGDYAKVTVISELPQAVESMAMVMEDLIVQAEQITGPTNVLNERFGRIGLGRSVGSNYQEVGSSWSLKCENNHEFHTHASPPSKPQLSVRMVQFYANKGFSIEIFPVEFAETGQALEHYVLERLGIVEIEFDGKFAHRFRPLDDGFLYAHSMHYAEVDDSMSAAETQTVPYSGPLPERTFQFLL